jgi:hypothetical protein
MGQHTTIFTRAKSVTTLLALSGNIRETKYVGSKRQFRGWWGTTKPENRSLVPAKRDNKHSSLLRRSRFMLSRAAPESRWRPTGKATGERSVFFVVILQEVRARASISPQGERYAGPPKEGRGNAWNRL